MPALPVFPTPVGVFPRSALVTRRKECLPHARGGVSLLSWTATSKIPSSPRPWGCFFLVDGLERADIVFPTPVGVFLLIFWSVRMAPCLPHARGGVSLAGPCYARQKESSPRPWGCFSITSTFILGFAVFPTPVGVFLTLIFIGRYRACLPHARGGVSFRFLASFS